MDIETLLQSLLENDHLTQAVLSSPSDKKAALTKIVIRPVLIQKKVKYQATFFYLKKTEHKNLSAPEAQALIEQQLKETFRQAVLFSNDADYHVLVNRLGQITILKKRATQNKLAPLEHNLPKQTILKEGQPIPFLVHLGVMSSSGKVIAQKYDKFRQINKYLEFIADIIKDHKFSSPIHIVDFGCGKSYLTFALYHYLQSVLGLAVDIVGLDLKEDVIATCNKLASELHFEHLHFEVGDIGHYEPKHKPEMVISLHACDTATDAALAQAIKWKARVILAVPCCQHEFFKQIHHKDLEPILKHGILKERFAALATDAARAHLLEIAGYKTQVMEFIDLEHTPKNVLIKAIRRNAPLPKKREEYNSFKQMLGFESSLEKWLKS